MRTRAFLFIALVSLALPLFAQEKIVATMQFSGEKAEAISSFSWGMSNPTPTPGDGGSAGKAVFTEFSFTKPVSQLSNTLFQGCATGKRFPSVVLKVADKKGTKEYYVIKLVDILITSYRLSGEGGDSTESTTLSYGSIEYVLIGQ